MNLFNDKFKYEKKNLNDSFYSDFFNYNNNSYLSSSFRKFQKINLNQNPITIRSKYFKTRFKQSIYDGVKLNKVSSLITIRNNFSKMKNQIRLHKNSDRSTHSKLSVTNNSSGINNSNLFLTSEIKLKEKKLKLRNRSMDDDKIKIKINNNENTNKELNKYLSNAKMHFKINNILYSKRIDNKEEFIKNCKDIYLTKILHSLQKEQIEYSSRDIKGETERKIINVKSNINYIISSKKKYIQDMDLYLNFLNKQKIKDFKQLEILQDKKYEVQSEVNSLILEIIKTQKQLKKMIKLRNFLLRVKEKIYVFPIKFVELYTKESKKEYIKKEINSLNIKANNSKIEELSFEDFDGELNQSQNDNKLKKMIPIMRIKRKKKTIKEIEKDKNNILINKLSYYILNKVPIFQNVDDFLNCYKDLENKILDLLLENEKNLKIIKELKSEYNLIIEDGNKYENFINKIINRNEEELKFIIKKYNHNKQVLSSLKNKKFNTIKKFDENFKSSINNSSFIDMDMVYFDKYSHLIKNSKYEFVILFNNIIHYVQNFLKLNYNNYTKDDFYKLISKQIYLNILKCKNNIDEYKLLIPDFIIKLLKVYENICEIILENHNNYKKNILNNYSIKFFSEIYQRKRNQKNTKQIRDLIIKKKDENKINIYKKTIKSVYIPKKKVPEQFNPKIFTIPKNSSKSYNNSKKEMELQSFILFE